MGDGFGPLLQCLTSSDNEVRNFAEKTFNGLRTDQPAVLIAQLLDILHQVRKGIDLSPRISTAGCSRPALTLRQLLCGSVLHQ